MLAYMLLFVCEVVMKCPKCESEKVIKHGKYTTLAGKFQKYHCQECGNNWSENNGKPNETNV